MCSLSNVRSAAMLRGDARGGNRHLLDLFGSLIVWRSAETCWCVGRSAVLVSGDMRGTLASPPGTIEASRPTLLSASSLSPDITRHATAARVGRLLEPASDLTVLPSPATVTAG